MSDRRDRFDESSNTSNEDRDRNRETGRFQDVRLSAQSAIRRASGLGNKKEGPPSGSKLKKLSETPTLLIGLLLVGLVTLAIVIYLITSRGEAPQTAQQAPASERAAQQSPAQQTPAQPSQQPSTQQQPAARGEEPFPFGLFSSPDIADETTGDVNWLQLSASIVLRLALAALLTAMLAFRPRKDLPVLQRNPYVAQTQILLAVVASALMMIVADNAARAFGIFAAASLVRFRTNIRDPKEITVLLVSLGIGLATGVGRPALAIILALFVLLVLWVLEYYEPAQIFRSMELTIATRRVDETDEIIREIFDKHNITSELRKVDREDEKNPIGKIVYYVNVNSGDSTDNLSEELFASDPDNIDSVQWDQKKSTSYIYR
ncbi:MAG TPA: DUF4956 domain-containing protein [Blastocatellia bacterium]|jgi:uncharacterized membrane protein YhiD involved in acid resistance